jgi:hypothetical protein
MTYASAFAFLWATVGMGHTLKSSSVWFQAREVPSLPLQSLIRFRGLR